MELPIYYLKEGKISFGSKPLFENINFQIMPKDRICLIGRNGCGKSTIMKIITGDIETDKGEIYKKPGIKIGYLPQSLIAAENIDVYKYVLENLENEKNSEDLTYLADQVLEPLNLKGLKPINHLSGGKARKMALAKALINKPDLLLLDEPTNHLDITAINWLQEFIHNFPGAIMCISHDRAFLREVTSKTFWLDQGILRINNKGYKNFEKWEDEIYSQEEENLRKLGKELDNEKLWLQQGVTARRKRNQRRLHNLYILREKMRFEQQKFSGKNSSIKLPLLDENKASKLIIEMENINHYFDDVSPPKITIKNFSMRILRGEKIGIMGRNGAGKSNLLKIINGIIKPKSGTIKLGVKTEISYFDQKREHLNPEKTLWETLCPSGGDRIKVGKNFKHVVAYLKDFMFDPKQAHSPVSTLSGGEASRLLLAKILADPGNFLILDEPTNDLDMDSLDMLQELLNEYSGTLIIVSHDREFLDNIVTRTLFFEGNGQIIDFIGGYNEYYTFKLGNDKKNKIEKTNDINVKKVILQDNKKENILKFSKNNKFTYNDKRNYEIIPTQIEEISKQIKKMEQQLAEENLYISNRKLFEKLVSELPLLKNEQNLLEEKWLELACKFENF